MTSVRTQGFRKSFEKLPTDIQALALEKVLLWKVDTTHPGLNFERVDDEDDIWSARIGDHYRALCSRRDGPDGTTRYVWFWIGPHAEYDKLI
jgi:hypothetical protein